METLEYLLFFMTEMDRIIALTNLISKVFDVPVGCTRNLLEYPQFFSCVPQFENP